MNPFDLRGPEFLAFYAVLATGVLLLLYAIRSQREDAEVLPKLEDPYLMAYLRDGPSGATETALISLIDRKLIVIENDQAVARSNAGVKHPLERALLNELGASRSAATAAGISLADQTDGYQAYLTKKGLLPDGNQKAARFRDTALACIFLAAVSFTKIAIAIARGRTNFIFLIILTIISIVVAFLIGNPRLTSLGSRVLDHLRTLLSRLKGNADSLRPNENTQDLMLLAAVFGVAAIPLTAMPERQMLYPQNTSSGDSGGGGDSGSSCGSSCGGGCGGGCGGCGS
ncbi:MAG: TIGR04222 domain-containing membrane protein [Acidobacteria bacterium]|nr:TIGR04222 domain-containing membrane protein [Acidobacteriota bacterium]